MESKKVQKTGRGKKIGEKESTSKKIKETKSMDLFEVMDEILKIKDQMITIKEDQIQIADSIRNRLEKLEIRVGIPR